eukprot:SAG31_NODE_1263_length_9072_cov_9.389390_3_plen_197_part_00
MLANNVYASFVIETDGRYGPYAQCNPTDSNGTFACAPNDCSGCSRAMSAVGYFNLSDIAWGAPALPAPYAMWKFNANVFLGANMAWFSTPAQGECPPGVRPGCTAGADASGCSWRVTKVGKVVNASCLDSNLIAAVEKSSRTTSACFAGCGPGHGRNISAPNQPMTGCGLRCFYSALYGSKVSSFRLQLAAGHIRV